jgi:hypothetical protein
MKFNSSKITVLFAVVLLFTVLARGRVHAAPGALDPSFGNGSRVSSVSFLGHATTPPMYTLFRHQTRRETTVANLEELYAAVNNPQNAGTTITITPGVYLLSVNDPNGVARPNSGRLELQENMSLQGVVGDRNAVVIDAINLPTSSFNNAPPIPLTAPIRMGRGANHVEWLTVRNAVNGAANIETDLVSTGTAYIRIAHIVSSGGQRGIDIRNFGPAMAGRVIQAEVVDNDLFNSVTGLGEGLRFVNNLGATGGVVTAIISDNRSHNNYIGLLIENNRSNLDNIQFSSTNSHF